MVKLFQRRFRVLLAAALAGFGVWKLSTDTPWLRPVDRASFQSVAGAFANPPFFISGEGTYQQPWGLRTLAAPDRKAKGTLPAALSIGDDKDGVFQASPPSPVDYAVILRNLDRLGVKHVAIGAVMAWDSSDPYAREAFSSRLKAFESVTAVSPLSRAPTEDPMPAEFARSSIPVDRVRGDVSKLPVVNHLPVPRTVLGDGANFAGFSELESEPASEARPLAARWGDRVVFAFPVVAVMAERGLEAEGVDLRLGSYLKLGPEGPVIPVDESGRATVAFAEKTDATPVEFVLDAESLASDGSVLIRDDRTVADRSAARFSAAVAPFMAAIRSEAGLSPPREFRRLSWEVEIGLISLLVVLLVIAAAPGSFRVKLWFGIFLGLLLAAQIITMNFSVWLPGLSFLGALAGGFIAAWPFERSRKTGAAVVSAAVVEPSMPVHAEKKPVPVQEEFHLEAEAVTIPPEPAAKPVPEKKAARKKETASPPPAPAKKAAKKAAKKVAKKAPRKKK
ncbi:hypothetical protein KBB96_19080 [Luteolibacter ambystomatis]|uniref:CHASE2 domain-containing protein n=1 Tax=Luteolibacter ambystomatis TaxID=2824561 RepID=A0A975G9Q6_9BACT|nr:hypothetical protein [Luteolibacter ambystomatis]QUE50950.1 hypothetical protein KBB96_19080 [Luteolibacter ambystomatis]